MATFKINGKNFATQDGTGAATVHSDVVFPTGHVLQVVQDESTETNTLTTSFAIFFFCSQVSTSCFLLCNKSNTDPPFQY